MDDSAAARRSPNALVAGPRAGLPRRVADLAVRPLFPGYFNLVMATGIVSNAFFILEHRTLSSALFVVNLVAYPLRALRMSLGHYSVRETSTISNTSIWSPFCTSL